MIDEEEQSAPPSPGPAPMPPPQAILVLSDLHFGEGDAMLAVRDGRDWAARARVDALIGWLAEHAPFAEIVLLGDIWELWTASFEEGHHESRYFFQRLAELACQRIVFLPGNHDHHLLVQHQLVEQIRTMRDDHTLEVPARTQRCFEDSHLARLLPTSAQARFLVSYPDHFASVGGQPVVFHHGHHTAILHEGPNIFASGLLFILQRLEEIGLHEVRRSDLELAGTILFELMYAVSHGSRTRRKMNNFWERYLRLRTRVASVTGAILHPIRWWLSRTERGTVAQEVGSYSAAVARILALAEEEQGQALPCAAYIFGHTHRAGLSRSANGHGPPRLLANAGTWLHEPGKRNESSEGTFLLLDAEAITLYRQGPDLTVRPIAQEGWPTP